MKMSKVEKVYVGINGVLVELTGEDLAAFEAQRELDLAEAAAMLAEAEVKAAARESALAKLAALGLTEDEIAAL